MSKAEQIELTRIELRQDRAAVYGDCLRELKNEEARNNKLQKQLNKANKRIADLEKAVANVVDGPADYLDIIEKLQTVLYKTKQGKQFAK